MSSIYKTIKKHGLKGEDKVHLAKKLLQECRGFASEINEKMKSIYKELRKNRSSKQGRHIKQILEIMMETIGEENTTNIATSKLEDLKKRQEHTRAKKMPLIPHIPHPVIGNISIDAQNSIVFAPSFAGNTGNINAGVNGLASMSRPSVLSDNPSDAVSNEPKTCSNEGIQAVKDAIKSRIRNRKEFQGMKMTEAVDLDEFYTEIHIIGSDFSEVNNNHEIWQVETAHMSYTSEGNVIKYHEIFKPGVGGKGCVKNVLTKGIAGIGKTITVKKYLCDWVKGRNKDDIDFDFVFLFPFRDLNKYKLGVYSLLELFYSFYPDLKKVDSASIFEGKLLLIFDGLDESDCPLAATNPVLTDVKEAASLDVLLTNLMRGKLLPSAHLWITTRPAAAAQLPEEILTDGYVTQIQGFNDQQKMKYFEKQVQDQNEARRVMSYLKSTRSLFIMCHVPLFCWMSARVLTSSQNGNKCGVSPKSLTEMYIHFLIILTGFSHKKYQGIQSRSDNLKQHHDIILKLGKLAFQYLEMPHMYFDENDFKNCNIDISDALKCPGLCAELLKMEWGLYSEKSYCFIHLSFQEFLAALYAFHEFSGNNHDALRCFKPKHGKFSNLTDFLNAVVDKAINNKNGHLDLFTRFIFGISLDSSKDLLKGFLPDQRSSNRYHKKVVQHIKALRKNNLCPHRCVNLVHCLVELHDKSFLEELKHHKPGLAKKPLTSFQCSALAYQLVTSEEVLSELDLKQYRITDEDCYRRLTPAIPFFKRVHLNCIGITKKFSPTLASALCMPNAQLTELDLSHNNLQSGMMCLSRGLCSPNCRIEKLNLSHNRLNYLDVQVIRDVLMSPHSRLKDLDLSNNDFQKSEVDALCAGLRSCRLSVLRLSGCCISSASFDSLAKALRSDESDQKNNLEELDLSYNPGDSAMGLLLQLKDSLDKLRIVNMDHAGECREKPWLHKYDVDLRLDPETANVNLNVSTNEKIVKRQTEKESYPDHPNRFDQCNQILCREGLNERHYWEVEKSGSEVHVGVAYSSIIRKGTGKGVLLGQNSDSWNFFWSDEKGKSTVSHNNITEPISVSSSWKMGIFLDWPAGTLSFYRIAGSMKELEEPEHLYTFHSTFKESVYPAFRIQNPGTTIFV
ncbi:NACHT, LRR and PYD domains-containing protein 3-like isoform X1 [Alosa pseudoharengus]|uniref:NACHT, LRR and PYD domains-containing protein 3-like isoform X1 n=2 Tax=Alosa pseudoharengus TaxID=34774 RepID=UPI003F89E0F5